jgi:predicted DNA-binding transcriptional regulator AlpA
MEESRLLTATKVAKYLGISSATFCRMVKLGECPPYISLLPQSKPRWRIEDVEEWLSKRISGTTNEKECKCHGTDNQNG